jgi:hypothetical protein
MQPDMFRLIDNCGDDDNDCSNMMIFQYQLRANNSDLPLTRNVSYNTIHPPEQWSLPSQKSFLRTNYKYMHEPRHLLAYAKGGSKEDEQYVMRGDYNGSWTECIANIRNGVWVLPYHGTVINSDNLDQFLAHYAAEMSDPDHAQLVLEFITKKSVTPEDSWDKVFEFEVNADQQEDKNEENEDSASQSDL